MGVNYGVERVRFVQPVRSGKRVRGKFTIASITPDEGGRFREEMDFAIEVEGMERVYAIADEDMDRENEEKTSAVHFVRFELTPAMRAAVKAGASVKVGCDHTNYPAHVAVSAETLASLASDLR